MVNCSNHSIILSKYFGMICKFVTHTPDLTNQVLTTAAAQP